MLETTATDGRGRTGVWRPGASKGAPDGPSASFPLLLHPDTTFAPAPTWAQAVLTLHPSPEPRLVEVVSGGTWFYPMAPGNASGAPTSGRPAPPGRVFVAPQPPVPTTKVQTVLAGDEFAILHDAAGWASNPKNLLPALVEARRTATPARLLWAPGIGTPADYALWVYLGVEVFDASPLLLAAARGQALTADGVTSPADAAALAGSATPLDARGLAAFNLEQARQELERVRHAIRDSQLRALVERRVATAAATVELLRRFDREHAYLEAATPRHRTTPLPAMTVDALWSPEVESFRRRFRDAYEPPREPRVLVLLPCSQRKPYKTSRSHRQFARVLDESGIRSAVHEVMVTSPLGLVPRELEEVYPANQYDIPVTGHWLRDEEAIVKEQLAAILSKKEYDHVIVHVGQGTFDVVRHLLPDHVRHTCLQHPTSQEDLLRLAEELARVKALLPPGAHAGAGRTRKLDDLRALASFQFNPAVADALVRGAQAHGRMPYVKLERDGVQLGTTTPDRGVLSLTLDGARVLAAHKTRRIHIGDFRPKGTSSLFAVGVESADADVRAGDDVVVVHGDEVRACGVAAMSAEEMTHVERGVAVVLRHTASPPQTAAKPAAPPEVLA